MSIKQEEDATLVALFISGNNDAFAVLLTRHGKAIFVQILNLLKDIVTAHDLYQEVCIKITDSLRAGKYKERGTVKAWMLRVSYNLCMDYLRKLSKDTKKNKKHEVVFYSKGGEEKAETDFMEIIPDEYSDSPEELLIEKERMEYDLSRLIEKLPKEQQEVLLLRIVWNFSFKEVARYTNAPINTCLGRMRYALKNLREMTKKFGDITQVKFVFLPESKN